MFLYKKSYTTQILYFRFLSTKSTWTAYYPFSHLCHKSPIKQLILHVFTHSHIHIHQTQKFEIRPKIVKKLLLSNFHFRFTNNRFI